MNEIVKERLRSLRDALMAFSLVNLCFIRTRSGLFFDKDTGYYKQLPLSKHVLLALALNLILFGLVGWRFARWIRRTKSPLRYRVACVVVGGLLLIPIDFVRSSFGIVGDRMMTWVMNPLFIGSVLLVLVAVWRWPRFVLRIQAVALMILVPAVFLTFGRIGYCFLQVRPEATPQYPALYSTPTPSMGPRVIWIIFDEMDQRMAFSNRPKDCPLPEFDRLCAESLQATNAFPPSGSTIVSLPALITGRYLIKAVPASRSELDITYANTSAPVEWSTQPTIFSRARSLGFNTALVGWYHPYSRLLASSLNYCRWYPYGYYQRSRDVTLLRSMIAQIWSLVPQLQLRWLHIDYYQRSTADASNLVKDDRYGLVLLHLPGAHAPGIYDPSKRTFTFTEFSRTRGYFDNLQLTDNTMGILRRDMEQTGQWDRSWVIVSADHWWREAWRYDGRMDHRVPFILKAPGKNQPVTYGSTLNTVITHDLILAILRKEVSTIPEVVAWLDTHKPPPAPPID